MHIYVSGQIQRTSYFEIVTSVYGVGILFTAKYFISKMEIYLRKEIWNIVCLFEVTHKRLYPWKLNNFYIFITQFVELISFHTHTAELCFKSSYEIFMINFFTRPNNFVLVERTFINVSRMSIEYRVW